jgi:rubrerythrin
MEEKDIEKEVRKIIVYVRPEIIALIPEFLENRKKDLIALRKAFEQEDYGIISNISFNMKGSGGSYGLNDISSISRSLEEAAHKQNREEIRELIEKLSHYLDDVEVLEEEKKVTCEGCGIAFEPGDTERYCPQCIVDKQERLIETTDVRHTTLKKEKSRIWIIIVILLSVAASVVLIIQIPKIFEQSRTGRPIRSGTYETDSMTDECINNLWKISRLFQENKTPDTLLVCPATNKPYRIESTSAYCPNPEAHGFNTIFVSKEAKIPKIIK